MSVGDGRLDEFVEQVRSRSDILQVVQSYVPLKRKGGRYWGCCPFHHEKTPSFSVVPDKGFFYCFGCHAGGNVFKFISLIENVTYFEAIKLQAEKLNIPMPERPRTPAEEARERELSALRKINEMARDFFHNCLTKTGYGRPGLAYFAGRGISETVIEEFSLGFAPDSWDKLSSAFMKRGVKPELLLKAGLVSESQRGGGGVYDRFRGRVIIPIADERGRVVGFGGRVLDDSQPKYLNTQETVLFNKRKLLFGLNRSHRAIKEAGYAIVVEGYMDAISVFGAGVENVVASLGTAFTVDHAKKLMRYAKEIYFCYDSDEAGQQATIRALSIAARDTGAVVKVITVPDGKDPDEFIRKHGAEAFRALVKEAKPLVDYRISYVLSHVPYDTLEGKGRALQEIMPVLTGVSQALLGEYVKKLAQTLMIDEGLVLEELRRYRKAPVEMVEPERAPIRQAVREKDTAAKRAGRLVIRSAWQDPGIILHTLTVVPLEGIADPVQREVLSFLQDCATSGERPEDASLQGRLSEEAAAELSRALVEDLGGREEAEAYTDSLRSLRKAYLESRYLAHTEKAEAKMQAGDMTYLEELNEVKRIKDEMDGM